MSYYRVLIYDIDMLGVLNHLAAPIKSYPYG